LRDHIRSLEYSVSPHAADALDDDELTTLDLESIILTGAIVERQRDRRSGETKRVVRGQTVDRSDGEVVVKAHSRGGLLVITVYLD
jgi:hypothetical protein